VSTEELAALYRNAFGLVMPTYFGPTNIPPLEAFALGCPVFYSDLPGLREQVAEGAFLFDPSSADSLVGQILAAEASPELRREKISQGRRMLDQGRPSDYLSVIRQILERTRLRLSTYRSC
jgi:glycosyltransferase involved in cell wall biosynthesis